MNHVGYVGRVFARRDEMICGIDKKCTIGTIKIFKNLVLKVFHKINSFKQEYITESG